MKIKFDEIKQASTKLLNNYNEYMQAPKSDEEVLASLYASDLPEEKQKLIDFFRSFDDAKDFMEKEYDIDPLSFNKMAGFTSEYKDAMQ